MAPTSSILLLVLVCLLVVAAPPPVSAGGPANLELHPSGTKYPYTVHIPPSGSTAVKAPYPCVLFLHGSGSSAAVSALATNTLWDGVGYLVAQYEGGKKTGVYQTVVESYVIVLPLNDVGGSNPDRSWLATGVMEVMNAVLADGKYASIIDKSRILVAGYSMGGKGSWTAAMSSPSFFSGLITSAGFNEFNSSLSALTAPLLAPLAPLPIRGFYGDKDEKQPGSTAQPVFDALKSVAAKDAVLEEIGGGTDHGGMSRIPWEREDLWAWAGGLKSGASSDRDVGVGGGGSTSGTAATVLVTTPPETSTEAPTASATTTATSESLADLMMRESTLSKIAIGALSLLVCGILATGFELRRKNRARRDGRLGDRESQTSTSATDSDVGSTDPEEDEKTELHLQRSKRRVTAAATKDRVQAGRSGRPHTE